MHIDMRDLQARVGELSVDNLDGVWGPGGWQSSAALNFQVSIQGAGTDYLRFPENSRYVWEWISPGSLTYTEAQYPGRLSWQIMVNADDLRVHGVNPAPEAVWTAWFTRTGHQTGIITVYHSGAPLHPSVVGNLRFDLPIQRIRAGNTTMTAFFPGGGVLAHGLLLGADVAGIDIATDIEAVGFEWIANLNTVIIRELATSALTRELTRHRDNRLSGGGNRAFAVRLIAPPGYHWSLESQGVGPRSGPMPATAGYGNVNWAPGTFASEVADTVYPVLSSPSNVLVFDRVARYVYPGVNQRSEMILIVENLRRNPSPVGEAAGAIHIDGLQLLPDDRAPMTGNVNIDIEIGTVSTVRAHRALGGYVNGVRVDGFGGHLYCPAGFSFGLHPGQPAGQATWPVRWTHENPWRSNREVDRALTPFWGPNTPPSPPSSLTRAQVEENHRRTNNCNYLATSLPALLGGNAEQGAPEWVVGGTPGQEGTPGQVVPPTITPGGMTGPALVTPPPANVQSAPCVNDEEERVAVQWRLDWYRFQYANRHVATRGIANLTLAVHGDLPELRSGYVDTDYVTATPGQPYVTGTTARLQIIENVPNALHLGIGAPISFTFPEGVQVMAFRWRMYPHERTGNETFNWTATPGGPTGQYGWTTVPPVNSPPVGAGGALTRWDGNTLTLTRNMPLVLNPRARTMEIEFRLAVEGGFAWQNSTNVIPVEVSGRAVEANLAPGASAVVAEVFDPVTVEFGNLPIRVPHDFHEQNIYHEEIGDIVIRETAGNRLRFGQEIWVYVERTYIQRAWDIILTTGGIITDDSGLTARVETWNSPVMDGTQFHGLVLTVTGESHTDTPGALTLTGNRVFGHVYPGEEYHIVVSGPAIARNHRLVSWVMTGAANINERRGVFNNMPYYEELIDASEQMATEDPFERTSLAGVTIREGVAIGPVASPLYFEPVPGTNLRAGYVSARAFAIISGFENIHWNGAGRIATLSGYDALGRWTVIQLSPDSVTATVTRAGATTHPDIAFVAGDSGPVGTIAPIHRNNRLYLPLRFMFNILAFDQFYEITGGPAVQSVTFVPLAD
jgi:hypothetical protein